MRDQKKYRGERRNQAKLEWRSYKPEGSWVEFWRQFRIDGPRRRMRRKTTRK